MAPSHLLARWATAVLIVGVLLAILTTRDPDWWGLHFSQLGTFGDESSKLFNGATLGAGILLAAYGTIIGADLPATMSLRRKRWIQRSLISAGTYLSLVGLVPIPLCPPLHDAIALGLVFSFISLIASALRCSSLTRDFQRLALIGLCLLLVGMALLFTQVITLAAYELLAFATLGVWLARLPRAIPASVGEALEPLTATMPTRGAPRGPRATRRSLSARPAVSTRPARTARPTPATRPAPVQRVRRPDPLSPTRPPRTVRTPQVAQGSMRSRTRRAPIRR